MRYRTETKKMKKKRRSCVKKLDKMK